MLLPLDQFFKGNSLFQDFEVYRMQRQIVAAEERMELRDAVKKRNLEELQNLKSRKMELEGELEILRQQNVKIARSLTVDMRILEEKNDTGAKLNVQFKNSMDNYKNILTETNAFKKEIKLLQMRHEQLTHATMRTAKDLFSNEKKMEVYQVEMDTLYDQFGRTSRLADGLTEQAETLQRVSIPPPTFRNIILNFGKLQKTLLEFYKKI
jgi:chromosome segregation ATPase